jgi:arylsulfatase A-like enzyme
LTDKQRDTQDLLMATFAAMIDIVDQNVGRIVAKLKAEGIYDNTLIVLLSDNGACPFDRTTSATLDNNYMPWDSRSFYCYTKEWANACNTPFRKYKQNQNEGGISTPMIAHWPNGIKKPGSFDRDIAHLVDLHATFADLAGVEYPKEFKGNKIVPPRGLSLAKTFTGKKRPIHDELYQNFRGKYSALRKGKWKLVDKKFLYDMNMDRIESKNLSETNPELFGEMKARWQKLNETYGGIKRRPKSNRNPNRERRDNR